MTVAGVNWTWIYWVLAIFSFVCLIAIAAGLPETYAPLLLAQKAKKLRQETGHPYWAPLDRKKSGIKARLNQTLVGPFKMLAEEPMLLSITLYMSFIYGVLYLDFVAYPIIFEQGHGMSAGSEGLMCTLSSSPVPRRSDRLLTCHPQYACSPAALHRCLPRRSRQRFLVQPSLRQGFGGLSSVAGSS